MRKNRHLFPVILLLFFLALILCACGKPADTSGLAGRYRLIGASEDASILAAKQICEHNIVLLLEENGKGLIYEDGSRGRLSWRMSGDTLTLDAGRLRFTGTLEESGFILTEKNSGALLRFERDEPESGSRASDGTPAENASAGEMPGDKTGETPALSQVSVDVGSVFSGGWYGWWRIDNSSGSMPESWYDCCAVFESEEDGSLKMTFWDENSSRSEPLSELRFELNEDRSIRSLSGYFLYDTVGEGEWLLPVPDPALWLEGRQHDAKGETFAYSIYLRPWGDDWSEAPAGQLPFYYSDWYLPLIQSVAEIPDEIPWQHLETQRES